MTIREEHLTITDAARVTGLSAHTLRYYERVGLIHPVPRTADGRRRYGAADLDWLAFLQRLRRTGMSIRDMRCFAELRRGGDRTIAERRRLLEHHHLQVTARISALRADLEALSDKINHYGELEAENATRIR